MNAQTLAARAVRAARRRLLAAGGTRVLLLDEAGIELAVKGPDRVVDVLFDGRRIWSFWLHRDTRLEANGRRVVAWPARMRPYLKGRSRITVREHVADVDLFEDDRSFGTSSDPIAFVNAAGLEISLDKSGRFSPTFSVRTPEQLAPLLDSIEQVIAMLGELGIEAFPAYGTLLGAVREGTFLGHDSDADLGYVSAYSTPAEAMRESFALQRQVVARGFSTWRYSGGAFRIDVVEADGSVRGLDLFGGFMDAGTLYLLGEVGVPFERSWIFPLETCTLAGRTLPAPARADLLLEAMYGPGWKVPDPAYKFTTPPAVVDRFNDWFRGLSAWRRDWERVLSSKATTLPPDEPSDLARLVAAEAAPGTHLLDIGAGHGRDALWLARQGFETTAYDYVVRASRRAVAAATEAGLRLDHRRLNLTEWRSTFSEIAVIGRRPGPRTILARHLLDATNEVGRDSFARFASVALRGGGRLYAEVWTGEGEPEFGIRPLPLAKVVALVEAHGGVVVSTEQYAAGGERPRSIGRLVAEWT